MNYREETEVREHLTNQLLDDRLMFDFIEPNTIADILEVPIS